MSYGEIKPTMVGGEYNFSMQKISQQNKQSLLKHGLVSESKSGFLHIEKSEFADELNDQAGIDNTVSEKELGTALQYYLQTHTSVTKPAPTYQEQSFTEEVISGGSKDGATLLAASIHPIAGIFTFFFTEQMDSWFDKQAKEVSSWFGLDHKEVEKPRIQLASAGSLDGLLGSSKSKPKPRTDLEKTFTRGSKFGVAIALSLVSPFMAPLSFGLSYLFDKQFKSIGTFFADAFKETSDDQKEQNARWAKIVSDSDSDFS
jgi:hypothetical protein